MEISRVRPYEKNAKKHPKKQVEQVAASIKEFGFNQPLVVDRNGVVIVGHGRLEAAKILGMTDVPVIEVDLTEEQAKAYRLADNKLNESEWDMKLAVDELKELSEEMAVLTGFDIDLLIEPDEKDDEIPENVPPVAQLGDLYQLGSHRVLCGDSTKMEDVERLMDGKKADMVFTDPPYGVDYEGVNNDHLKAEKLREFIFDALSLVWASLREGSNAYVWHPDVHAYEFIGAFRDAGFIQARPSTIQWVKDSLVMSQGDYHSRNEPCLYGWKEGKNRQRVLDRKQDTIWECPKPKKAEGHPTMKPIEICSRAIINSSKDGEIVIDTFLGSGSTLIASEKTGRICYGMELDPKYVDVIIQRYVDYTGNATIKKNGQEIIWQKTVKETEKTT